MLDELDELRDEYGRDPHGHSEEHKIKEALRRAREKMAQLDNALKRQMKRATTITDILRPPQIQRDEEHKRASRIRGVNTICLCAQEALAIFRAQQAEKEKEEADADGAPAASVS